jgi:hypothetical protein
MPESTPPDKLRLYSRGEVINRPVINALIEFVRSRTAGRGTFTDGGASSPRPTGHSRDELSWVRCESEVDAPPFSVVEVYDSRLDDNGIVLIVREAAEGAALYAGNEDYELINGAQGWVKLLTPYEPVVINVHDDSDPIVFGDTLTVEELRVTSGSGSLLALTPETTAYTGTGTGQGTIARVAVLAPSGQVEMWHGTVQGPCNTNCGTYYIQRLIRSLKTGCEDCGDTGTGTGSGSGT